MPGPCRTCCAPSGPCGNICVHVQSSCFGNPSIDGATVTVLLGGTTIGTGTTSGQVSSVNVTSGGGGYTSVPHVTFSAPPSGTTATGTANLGTTNIAGVTLTGGGSGYTTAPAVSITGGHGQFATVTAALNPSPVVGFTVTNGGANYTSAPTLTLSGGNGTGAAITALMGVDSNSLAITGGSGYTSAPNVVFSAPPSGTTATGTATVSGGAVTALTITNPGSGYTAPPTITIDPPTSGTTATATCKLKLVGGTITAGGANYTTGPTVAVSGGGGSAAAAATALNPSPVASLTLGNHGSGYQLGDQPTVGFSGGGGGSGATATCAIGTFAVNTVTITNPGSNYGTTAPTVTFDPPPSGTTAAGTAVLRSQCCIPITQAGTYTIQASAADFHNGTSTVTLATCSNSNPSITLTRVSGTVRFNAPACPASGANLPNLPIAVTLGGSTVGTCTTAADGTGTCDLDLATNTTYTATASRPRWTFPGNSFNTSTLCNTVFETLTANVASGYVCTNFTGSGGAGASSTCMDPIATTLHLTDPVYGPVILGFNAAGANGAGWYGTLTVNVGACAGSGCAASSGVLIQYYVPTNGGLTINYSTASGSSCPGAYTGSNLGGAAIGGGFTSSTCASPTTAFSATINVTDSGRFLYCSGSATMTLSE